MINVEERCRDIWDDYFVWLCGCIDDKRFMDIWDHYEVLKIMHNTPFEYSIPKDGNRVADAFGLRGRFASESSACLPYDVAYDDVREILSYFEKRQAYVLEVLIALAERLDDITSDIEEPPKPAYWFRMFMENLSLFTPVFSPVNSPNFSRKTSGILKKWMSRQYDYYGNGNIFRLEKPVKDFNKIEIWYQMHQFLEQKTGIPDFSGV